MNKGQEFFNYACELMQTVQREETEHLEQAAQAVKNAIVGDGMIYSFGTGHSVILCAETSRRAGGLAN